MKRILTTLVTAITAATLTMTAQAAVTTKKVPVKVTTTKVTTTTHTSTKPVATTKKATKPVAKKATHHTTKTSKKMAPKKAVKTSEVNIDIPADLKINETGNHVAAPAQPMMTQPAVVVNP